MYRLLPVLTIGLLAALQAPVTPERPPRVLSVSVGGVVHPATVAILDSAIAQAQREQHRAIVIRLNTPGGFVEATRAATEKILKSPVPVVTWVGPAGARAASAGFFLLEAGDIAAMAPGTNTGAAHPVMLGGTPDATLMKKIENDSAASLRAVVARRGRNAEAAEKAVVDSKSFTDAEALSESLIDLPAADMGELLRRLDGREVRRFDGSTTRLELSRAEVIEYQPTLSQRVQTMLSDPNLALGVLLLGGLLLYFEIATPGAILPGVAGAILVLLGLSAFSVLPVTATGVLLMLLAVALFVLEVKIVSHGVLGTGGAVALALGATLLIDSPLPELRIRPIAALALTFPFALILFFLIGLAVRARNSRVESGAEAFPGQMAVALTAIQPAGKVLFQGEIWNARTSTSAEANAPVRVVSIDGLELQVEPVPAPATGPAGGEHGSRTSDASDRNPDRGAVPAVEHQSAPRV